jgi:hypothetical protein
MFHQQTLTLPPRPHTPPHALTLEQQSLEEQFSPLEVSTRWSLMAFFTWIFATMLHVVQQG